jgi:hypothetical protein
VKVPPAKSDLPEPSSWTARHSISPSSIPFPTRDHAAPSQRTKSCRSSEVDRWCCVPAYSASPAPSSKSARAFANARSPFPEPIEDQEESDHRATWFAVTPPAVSNEPPT